ncbi:hypothetical protein I580_01635 [Enterococcus caccae ATCC BAA-1240]|uniref:Uncharacterized protein n=2 Tax=Enterococcus caccae TaxID=317735 RepID=R3WES7_9ENTE|nr:hypothetical protein UC7_01333 [Enterococcus caccae ATCC BAA-1240]EOT60735.1 hypothetical protein I580_01635 [Enterococcus caccae ATCC BAA-1240]
MKDKKKYYEKYRNYYFCEIVLLVGWITNFILFSRFYKESIFYVDKQAKLVIQILFMVNYYLEDVLLYLFVSFLVMTLNLLLILMFYIKSKQSMVRQKEMKYSMILFLIIIGINAIALLNTIIWPLFLLVFIFSLTVVYIIYVITKYLYEGKDELYEDNELIKIEVGFQTKEEAEKYTEEFLTYWADDFERKGYRLVDSIKKDPKKEWYVEFFTQIIK